MDIVLTGRQGGKTYRMLDWLRADPAKRLLVVTDTQTRECALRRVSEMWGPQTARELKGSIMTSDQALRGDHRGSHKTLGIDDADVMLTRLLGQQVEAMSATVEQGQAW